MKTAIKAYLGFLATFLVIDIAFITLFAQQFYADQVGELLREEPKMVSAILFYMVYAGVAVRLIVLPNNSAIKATINGALLGLVAYGTYTFTNYAMLEGWTVTVVLVDVTWGMLATAACCFIGFRASN